jgi:hypothetical protein
MGTNGWSEGGRIDWSEAENWAGGSAPTAAEKIGTLTPAR